MLGSGVNDFVAQWDRAVAMGGFPSQGGGPSDNGDKATCENHQCEFIEYRVIEPRHNIFEHLDPFPFLPTERLNRDLPTRVQIPVWQRRLL